MKAIILAAGAARRFGDYLNGKPKCLLPLAGATLLERQVDQLARAGLTELVLVKGYQADHITLPGARVWVNPDYARTNMVHSLFCAADEIVGDVLIVYADILYEEQIIRDLVASPHAISVAVDQDWERYYQARYDDPYAEAESLVLGPDHRVFEIGASNPPPARVEGQYIGMIRLSALGSRHFTENYRQWAERFAGKEWVRGRRFESAYMTDFLQALVDQGVPVHATLIRGGWLEFDSPTDYEKVLAWHKQGQLDRFHRLQSVVAE